MAQSINLESYTSRKKEILDKLSIYRERFSRLQDITCNMGIEELNALNKIDAVMESVRDDIISIVLVGAFSDGKTTVASGLLGQKLQKIDLDESSTDIAFYDPPSDIAQNCRIVDTPGLFGTKVEIGADGKSIRLSDKTRKFVDEASVILYVVESKNPIKDSHKESLKWILGTLGKLSRTIFVINKMDEVADLTDERDFTLKSNTKKDNLMSKVKSVCPELSDEELAALKIICVSSAPNGKDLDFWLSHKATYDKRSHLGELLVATNEVLKDARGLSEKAGIEALENLLRRTWETIGVIIDKNKELLVELNKMIERNSDQIDNLKTRIAQNRQNLSHDLDVLCTKKINAIYGSTRENLGDTFRTEIGEKGEAIEADINKLLEKYIDTIAKNVHGVIGAFESEYNKFAASSDVINMTTLQMLAGGMSIGMGTVSSTAISASVFAGRDLLKGLGIVIKFRPWQVANFASAAAAFSKAIPVIGAAVTVVAEVAGGILNAKADNDFKTKKAEVIYSIKDAMDKANVNVLKSYDEMTAPVCDEIEKHLAPVKANRDKGKEVIEKLEAWKEEMKGI